MMKHVDQYRSLLQKETIFLTSIDRTRYEKHLNELKLNTANTKTRRRIENVRKSKI